MQRSGVRSPRRPPKHRTILYRSRVGRAALASDKIAPEETVMMPPRKFSPCSRRDFLKQTAAFAAAGGILLPRLTAQEAKFVTAETIYGKIPPAAANAAV